MQALALCGLIALAFGAGSYQATGQPGWFAAANLALGAAALLAAAGLALRRLGGAGSPALRRVLLRGLLAIAATLLVAVAAERLAARSGLEIDWSYQERFQISDATRRALAALGGAEATLYSEAGDPRSRSTRLLLETIAQSGGLRVSEKRLAEHPEDADLYGIGSGNTVLVRAGGGFETVERPTEGSLFEAFERLREREQRILYVMQGAGEGDPGDEGALGFSGLAAALATEGYEVRPLVTAAASEVPADADVLLSLAPRRRLREESLAALRAWLGRGGHLVAFLEPGAESGLGEVLAEWGIASPDAVVVDPASAPVDEEAPGVNPLAFQYASSHPAARGLLPGRMTFFRGARSFTLRKPGPGDQVEGVVFTSGRAWLTPDASVLGRRSAPERPAGAEEDFHPLVVAARYPRPVSRPEGETRIVAFGDSDLASNQNLRTLYNLDLVLNAIHWAAQREPEITIRPKIAVSGALQLPLPVQNTLLMFQSVGLLVPELCLLGAALTWLRRRGA